MVAQVQRVRLAEQTARLLAERIGAGEWGLGDTLPGEATLAAQLGVGRSTMREAIRELAGRGIVESRQGAGVFVLTTTAPEDRAGVLRRATIAQVLEARIAVETAAAASAARRRTDADLGAIDAALDARGAATDSVAQLVDADMAFHRAITVAAHNDVLTDVFDSLAPRIRPAMIDMLRIPARFSPHTDQDAHRLLAQAVRAQDPAAAAAHSRTHLEHMMEDFT